MPVAATGLWAHSRSRDRRLRVDGRYHADCRLLDSYRRDCHRRDRRRFLYVGALGSPDAANLSETIRRRCRQARRLSAESS